MEEISACRACLATDGKLHDMFQYELVSHFENLTGIQILKLDGLPHRMCTYCAAMLRKCAAFQNKCRFSQDMLSYAVIEGQAITADYIRSLDRQTHNLITTTTTYSYMDVKQEDYMDNDLTSLLNNIIGQNTVKVEDNSDEEPLAKIAKKNKKRKKKHERASQPKPTQEKKEQITIKEEMDLATLHDCFDDNFGPGDQDDNLEPCDQDENNGKTEFLYDQQMEVVSLSKEEQIQEVQARKNSTNYLNSFYKCDLCYKGYMIETTYRNHMERHDPRYGSFSCDVCHLRFPSNKTLQQHSLASHARRYTCAQCGHTCKAASRAKEHFRWHQGVMYVCDICGASFVKPTSHLTHVRTHHPSRHVCLVCSVSFVSSHGLHMHTNKAHRNTQGKEVPAVHMCVVCRVNFKCKEALNKHLSLTNDGDCDTSLRPCVFCGQSFLTDDSLRRHKTTHIEEKQFHCIECNKSFSSARYQAAHYRRLHARTAKPSRGKLHATAATAAVCEVCGKKCKSRATLVYHQRTHSGEKPYQCGECPKRFSVLQRLQIHVRTHTGERPCQCAHCPKAFKHKAALNRHLRVHTGAKPYQCPHCGKSFSQSNTMKGHVRSVHLKLPNLYRRPTKRDSE